MPDPQQERSAFKVNKLKEVWKKRRLLARPHKLHKWVSNLATWAFFQLCTLSHPQLQAWMSSLTILQFFAFFFNDQNWSIMFLEPGGCVVFKQGECLEFLQPYLQRPLWNGWKPKAAMFELLTSSYLVSSWFLRAHMRSTVGRAVNTPLSF